MPAAAPVIEHAAAPDGADERWRLLYESALDQYERHDNVTPGWLSLDDAAELNSNLARAWVREQRRRVIEDALMTTGQNGPRLNGRGQSLVGGPITHVIVLPVVGQYSARPMTQILVTSLDTFLNDAAWATAITS